MASTFDSDAPGTEQPAQPAQPAHGSEPQVELVLRILLGALTPEQACAQAGIDEAELKEWLRRHRRAARRLLDDRIAATLAAHGVARDDFVIAGNLETMALADLLSTVHLGRKDAHIRIEHEGEYGHLWCSDGDVIDAQVGELSGVAAAFELLELREGRLQAEFTSEARERTIVLPTDVLLLESARRADQARALRELIDEGQRASEAPEPVAWRPPQDTASGNAPRLSEISVPPVVPSLTSLRQWPAPVQRYGVVPIAAGALVLTFVLAFGAGSWKGSVRAERSERALAAQAPSLVKLSSALCGSTMTLIPAGAGTPADVPEGESEPVLRPFCLARQLVTSAEYQACVISQRCPPARVDDAASHDDGTSARCNAGAPGREHLPINCVTQLGAREYCAWRGQRLPAPAEWELAWRWQQDARGDGASTSGEATSGASTSDRTSGVSTSGSGTSGSGTSGSGTSGSGTSGASTSGEATTLAALGLGESSEWTRGPVSHGAMAEQELYAVLGGKTQRDWSSKQPRRLYTSASTDGLGLGFRCAADLTLAGAVHEPAAARAPAP